MVVYIQPFFYCCFVYLLTLISYAVSFFRMAIYSLTLISFAVSFLLFPSFAYAHQLRSLLFHRSFTKS